MGEEQFVGLVGFIEFRELNGFVELLGS